MEDRKPREDYSKYSLSIEEVKKLIETCDNVRDKCILLLMLHSALRSHEVVNLRMENIDWERRLIHLKTYKGVKRYLKNDEELTIPISDKCFEYLSILKKETKGNWLFPSPKKRDRPITSNEINHLVAKWGDEAGLTSPLPQKDVARSYRPYTLHKKINPHLLRHTCIRLYLKNGGDIRMAQKLARHSNIALTLQTYGTPSIEDRVREYKQVVNW